LRAVFTTSHHHLCSTEVSSASLLSSARSVTTSTNIERHSHCPQCQGYPISIISYDFLDKQTHREDYQYHYDLCGISNRQRVCFKFHWFTTIGGVVYLLLAIALPPPGMFSVSTPLKYLGQHSRSTIRRNRTPRSFLHRLTLTRRCQFSALNVSS